MMSDGIYKFNFWVGIFCTENSSILRPFFVGRIFDVFFFFPNPKKLSKHFKKVFRAF
eukprot:TRINITY_DN1592_c0_g2_i1.p2 TRINITY_DN1592_c0_g2~~TRINITY_DN1592_c0_g2_i1.p2  ORF type:complete len:57 (-),score=0.65 TRINITY_DN1592_c0_g2_i1:313-483(-)